MRMTKVFKCGNSQAVRLPKEFQFNSNEVEIFRSNGDIVIRDIPKNLARAFKLLAEFPDDFFSKKRKDALPQKRDFFE